MILMITDDVDLRSSPSPREKNLTKQTSPMPNQHSAASSSRGYTTPDGDFEMVDIQIDHQFGVGLPKPSRAPGAGPAL
jgi:hypothetical protein